MCRIRGLNPPDQAGYPRRSKWAFSLWVKISLLVGLVAAAAFLIFHLTGNGMAGMHG